MLQYHGAKGARGNQRLTMGPFGHGELSGELGLSRGNDRLGGAPAAIRPNSNDVRWFDYWLKGVQNGVMSEPPVDCFLHGVCARRAPTRQRTIGCTRGGGPSPTAPRELLPGAEGHGAFDHRAARRRLRVQDVTYRFDPKPTPCPTFGGANLTFERGPEDQRQIKGTARLPALPDASFGPGTPPSPAR